MTKTTVLPCFVRCRRIATKKFYAKNIFIFFFHKKKYFCTLKKTTNFYIIMKNNFSFFFDKMFYHGLWVIVILICFTACNKRHPKPVFDLNTPGGQVMASYNDSTPQVVFYYKLDKNGNPTDEKIGETFYYENKQEYIGGGLKDEKREGKWYAFFRDGSVQTEAFYIDGKEHGAYNVYQENGKPLYKGHYDHGNCD
jgi:hypothetical protein